MFEKPTSSPNSNPIMFDDVYSFDRELAVHITSHTEPFPRDEPFERALAFDRYLARDKLPSAYLVEDNASVRRSTAAVLRDIGFEVHPYNSGIDLLRSVSRELTTVRFLFSDYHMPYLSGYGLCQEVRKIWPNAKVLLMSGDSESSLVGEGTPTDWPMFIPKPFTYDELIRKLEELFRNDSVES